MTDKPDRATDNCRRGWHTDDDNTGMCIHCGLLLWTDDGEEPNDFRRRNGWPDVPAEPIDDTL